MAGEAREDTSMFNIERTMRFFCYGLAMSAFSNWSHFIGFSLFSGPIMGRWNIFLERRFPSRRLQMGKLSIKSLSKRLAADQLVMYVIQRSYQFIRLMLSISIFLPQGTHWRMLSAL